MRFPHHILASVFLFFFLGSSLTHAFDRMELFPEDRMMYDLFLEKDVFFPTGKKELTVQDAITLVQSVRGKCLKKEEDILSMTCIKDPGLFAKKKKDATVSKGEFLQVLYGEGHEKIQALTKKYPDLAKEENMIAIRAAWEEGLIEGYEDVNAISEEDARSIIFRALILEMYRSSGVTKYMEGLVADTEHITEEFFQDAVQIDSIIKELQKKITYTKSTKKQKTLTTLLRAYKELYRVVVENEKVYQLRPFGNPVSAGYGDEVVISYHFKDPRYTTHTGTDIAPLYDKKHELGDIPVVARQSGIAIFIEMEHYHSGRSLSGYGNHVIILSEDFFRRIEGDTSLSKKKDVFATLYGHMKHFGEYEPVDNPVYYESLVRKFYNSKNWGSFNPFKDIKIVGIKTVSVGDQLGVMGNTGRSTNDHLHYEVRSIKEQNGIIHYLDPVNFALDVPSYDIAFTKGMELGVGGLE